MTFGIDFLNNAAVDNVSQFQNPAAQPRQSVAAADRQK
jgi:hypothetical protein